jgi:translation initiation factor 2B subunit (eIF-2B alpha/beta/delta family)
MTRDQTQFRARQSREHEHALNAVAKEKDTKQVAELKSQWAKKESALQAVHATLTTLQERVDRVETGSIESIKTIAALRDVLVSKETKVADLRSKSADAESSHSAAQERDHEASSNHRHLE